MHLMLSILQGQKCRWYSLLIRLNAVSWWSPQTQVFFPRRPQHCLMPAPTNTSELRRFLGMANQLGKFSPKLSELSQPLRALLSSKNTWVWGDHQETAFNLIKRELTMPTVLSLYDPSADTKIAADASSFGLGAVLLQKRQSEWRPVAYASRALTETECRYAQIEKEGLASTWACERFSDYIQCF